ncbi:MAG TPA: hypothetical protein VLA84_21460, partial [Microcoleus sp.]|nr:hypothetical protein [Microcoleus sp.]
MLQATNSQTKRTKAMIISDLNYLETAETSVVGGFNLGYDFSKIYFNEYFTIKKDVVSKTYVEGN